MSPRPGHILGLLCLLVATGCGGPETRAGDVAGVYLLDRDDLAGTLLRERVDALSAKVRAALPQERRRAMLDDARATARLSDLRLDLLTDGAFVVRYRFGQEQGRRRGTWSLGGGAVHLRTTHSATGPLAQPLEHEARLEDGGLRFRRSDDVPHPFLLRRR